MGALAAAAAARDVQRRRLRVRSWHRGTREMDLILGGYADGALRSLDPEGLDRLEALISEADHELYRWIAGGHEAPAAYAETIARIRAFHRIG